MHSEEAKFVERPLRKGETGASFQRGEQLVIRDHVFEIADADPAGMYLKFIGPAPALKRKLAAKKLKRDRARSKRRRGQK